ncbi:MAG: hypothetical protein KDE33_29505 [Bacteroidetes bacterium]|nr:hypothetical protein [Bacteroidota bacterium]MCB9321390.1 hypothetical protein [Lewinellaceae bacterium]
MNNIIKGLIAGLILGIVSIIPMLFMEFEDKRKAIIASFVNRFSIGFIIFNIDLPIHGWLKGLIIGGVLSFPDALITKAFKPIMALGLIGGLVCGLLT